MSDQIQQPFPDHFEDMYQGQSVIGATMPWDIGRPQPPIAAAAAAGEITGHVLDAGCGMGDNAIHLAACGLRVTAIDISTTAIAEATRRAESATGDVTFVLDDLMRLTGYENTFDTVVDSACYHSLDDERRVSYLRTLRRITRRGGRLHLFCFSAELGGAIPGPQRITVGHLRSVVGRHWDVESIRATVFASSLTADAVRDLLPPGTQDDLEIDADGRVGMPVWHLTARRRDDARADDV